MKHTHPTKVIVNQDDSTHQPSLTKTIDYKGLKVYKDIDPGQATHYYFTIDKTTAHEETINDFDKLKEIGTECTIDFLNEQDRHAFDFDLNHNKPINAIHIEMDESSDHCIFIGSTDIIFRGKERVIVYNENPHHQDNRISIGTVGSDGITLDGKQFTGVSFTRRSHIQVSSDQSKLIVNGKEIPLDDDNWRINGNPVKLEHIFSYQTPTNEPSDSLRKNSQHIGFEVFRTDNLYVMIYDGWYNLTQPESLELATLTNGDITETIEICNMAFNELRTFETNTPFNVDSSFLVVRGGDTILRSYKMGKYETYKQLNQ